MSGSLADLRPDWTVSVFTARKLSAHSSNILMKMLRDASWFVWPQNSTPMADQRIPAR